MDEKGFLPSDLVVESLSRLKSREAEIIRLRFGLNQEGRELTLEKVGRNFEITRERVRQLEAAALKELAERSPQALRHFFAEIQEYAAAHGGLLTLNELLKVFRAKERGSLLLERNSLRLLLKIDSDLVPFASPNKEAYRLRSVPADQAFHLADQLRELFRQRKNPLTLAQITSALKGKRESIQSVLAALEEFAETQDGKWGLKIWPEVSPKRIRDKIYIALKSAGHPMHFREITDWINAKGLSPRAVLSRTVHNELIYDQRFVLIGRGIYALREWGYKPGVVADVIEEILREAGRSLKLDEIIREALKRRTVKRNTIVANLQNKARFLNLGKATYTLAGQPQG